MTTTAAPFDWQQTIWRQLLTIRDKGSHSGSLLLQGDPGTGVEDLARAWAALRVCSAGGLEACGRCRDCQQREAGAHPDLLLVQRLEDKRELLIEQIRRFCSRIQLTSNSERGRIGVILEADRLNAAAANALLKTLEEPGQGVTLILTCSRLSRVMPTIRSRCQRLRVPRPTVEQSRAVLQALGLAPDKMPADLGAPLLAWQQAQAGTSPDPAQWQQRIAQLEQGRDVLQLAKDADDAHYVDFLRWWQRQVIEQMKRGRYGGHFARLWDALARARREAEGSFNRLLTLEGLFILAEQLHRQQKRGEAL